MSAQRGGLLAIDLGSTAVKVLIADAVTGVPLALTRRSSGAETLGTAGAAEQDPEGWWGAICDAVREALVKAGAIEKNGKKCQIRMISPETDPDAAKGKPIKGFPTFLMETADGQVVEYKGERSMDGYLEFINKTLSGGSA